MGIDFALDELYATGWSDLDSAGCGRHADGRGYPKLDRIAQEFAAAGFEFRLRRIDLFHCFRAEWLDGEGAVQGAVVSYSDTEASVFALAQFRRQLVAGTA